MEISTESPITSEQRCCFRTYTDFHRLSIFGHMGLHNLAFPRKNIILDGEGDDECSYSTPYRHFSEAAQVCNSCHEGQIDPCNLLLSVGFNLLLRQTDT